MNSPWVVGVVSRYWLVTWFAVHTLLGLLQWASDIRYTFFDARLYVHATREWLGGGNPWQVSLDGNFFAAPPPTLLPLVPFALLPGDLGWITVAATCVVGAFLTVRLLGLPLWWILFPPLVQSVLAGNVQALLVPLILLRLGWLGGLLKVYAAVPLVLLMRGRSLLILAVVLAWSVLVLPWTLFLADLDSISGRLAQQNEHGLPNLVLLALAPLIVTALILVGRERGAWLAVPALWPSQQYYYGTLVLPARSGLAAALVALPVAGSGLIALFAVAFLSWRERRLVDASTEGAPD